MVDAEGFESVYKMSRSTFSYVCSLVKIPLLEHMMASDHTFVDGRVLSLQDRVAVALRMLNSGEPPVTVGSSAGVDESTASLVTQVFIEAMAKRTSHLLNWPYTSEMEKIKRKFYKVYGLPNCCGVVHTARIKFASQNPDKENDGILMQTLIDPDMRMRDCWQGSFGNMNQSSILHDSSLFKSSESGTCLNSSKLRLSDGSDVGEYVVGDAGYPLLPWLLTPYQLENDVPLSDSKVEFNRRHNAAIAIAQKALARLKDTWKCLQGEGWHPNNQREMFWTIKTCCLLHNLVIYMEEEEEEDCAGMASDQEQHTIGQVRRIVDEDAVRARDALSRHMMESGGKLT
jgi:hypothetical protein